METVYNTSELVSGKCTCCAEKSTTIVAADGRCTDCIEEARFFDATMKPRCPECQDRTSQKELDAFGGICENCILMEP